MKRTFLCGTIIFAFASTANHAQTQPKPQIRPALPFTLSKETTIITAPLNPDGTPNYVQALNDKYGKGVTPENNGFVVYLQAVGTGDAILAPKTRDKVLLLAGVKAALPNSPAFKRLEDYGENAELDDAGKERVKTDLSEAARRLWKESEHPEIARYLSSQQEFLDILVKASVKPRWWHPYVSEDNRTDFLLPSLGTARSAGYTLAARATCRAANGDIDGLVRDVIAVERLGRLIGSGSSTIEKLVGISMDSIGLQALGAAVGAGRLTEEQCKAAMVLLNSLAPEPSIGEAADIAERWTQLEEAALLAMRKYEGPLDGSAEPLIKLANGPAFSVIHWDTVLTSINRTADDVVSTIKKSQLSDVRQGQKERDKSLAKLQSELADRSSHAQQPAELAPVISELTAQAIASGFASNLSLAEEQARRVALTTQMSKLLLAAAQVHAKTGKWPEKLADLAPSYIKQIPRDLYPIENPGELQYTITPAGIRIASIGDNNRPFGVGIQLP